MAYTHIGNSYENRPTGRVNRKPTYR